MLIAVCGMVTLGATSCGGDEACCEKDGKECTKKECDKADHEGHDHAEGEGHDGHEH